MSRQQYETELLKSLRLYGTVEEQRTYLKDLMEQVEEYYEAYTI